MLVFTGGRTMSGILVAYARFVEVQQRRTCIVAELSPSRETQAPRTQPAAADEPNDAGEDRSAPNAAQVAARSTVADAAMRAHPDSISQ
jgi:hypothetical protein